MREHVQSHQQHNDASEKLQQVGLGRARNVQDGVPEFPPSGLESGSVALLTDERDLVHQEQIEEGLDELRPVGNAKCQLLAQKLVQEEFAEVEARVESAPRSESLLQVRISGSEIARSTHTEIGPGLRGDAGASSAEYRDSGDERGAKDHEEQELASQGWQARTA